MAKTNRQGQKQCPACKKWVKGTRTRACPKCDYDFTGKQPAPEATPAPVEKAANTVTVEQVKAVAQTVKAIGGADRLNELLGLIREVGGLRRFKDLLDAMS
jgi:uncharacterized Zn finger protein (UPF0148 family)